MKILAWFLFVMACIKFIGCLQGAITEEVSKDKATEEFWRALFAIPTIVFFILFLFC